MSRDKKMTTEECQKILALKKDGVKVTDIARRYNITSSTVYNILNGRHATQIAESLEHVVTEEEIQQTSRCRSCGTPTNLATCLVCAARATASRNRF